MFGCWNVANPFQRKLIRADLSKDAWVQSFVLRPLSLLCRTSSYSKSQKSVKREHKSIFGTLWSLWYYQSRRICFNSTKFRFHLQRGGFPYYIVPRTKDVVQMFYLPTIHFTCRLLNITFINHIKSFLYSHEINFWRKNIFRNVWVGVVMPKNELF